MQNDEVYYTTQKYSNMTDEQIVNKIKLEDDELALKYIITKYKDLVNSKVGKYFIIGAEKEDIVQEGMIGLFKAIKSFNLEKQNSFKTFANICIERQLITAIKTSNRQKHLPLNSYLSLNISAYNNDIDNGAELLEKFKNDIVEDPLETIMKQEHYEEIKKIMNESLSKLEKKVLERFLIGESYELIAQSLNCSVKSIDNAIQRIRKKALKNIL